MKTIGSIFRLLFILAIPGLCMMESAGQKVESEYVGIRFNNLPDTEPPVIKILSPVSLEQGNIQTEHEELRIIGEVTDKSGIKYVMLGDELIEINEMGLFTRKIPLTEGVNRYNLVASDMKENKSERALTVEYVPPVATLMDKIRKEATYYGLIIGVDKYDDPNLPDLDNPVKDAEKIREVLVSRYNFSEENLILLKNARRDDIVMALDDLAGKVTPQDNVLIFYAGHGTWDEKANIGYWLPRDAYLNSTIRWFRNSTLVDYLKVIDSKHTLLITDACFAGSIFQTRSAKPKQDRAFEILYDLNSRKAMTSGTLTEVPDRSSFTRFLLERLSENEEPYLSSEQLFSSFRIAVMNNSEAIPQYGEIRNVGDEGGDFIFVKKQD